MAFLSRCIAVYHAVSNAWLRIPSVVRDLFVSAIFLAGAYVSSSILIHHTGGENNSALMFTLAVAFISLLTTGYFYGILASVVGTFFINYYFMLPYAEFDLTRTGYPVAMLSMLAVSCIVCALTGRVKQQAAESKAREQRTLELYRQNQKLNEEKAAIQLASAQETIRGNILRSVSHDLRTPLTAISGSASVLLSSEDISPKNVSMVRDIKSDADALIVMVENLLSVTRIQDGTMSLKTQDEMLEEVAGDALITTRRRFPDAHVELDLSEDILYLPMDSMLIRQVLINLLENAIRHSGDLEHIVLRLYRKDDWAVAEVRDRGKGLTPDIIETIKEGKPMSKKNSGDSTRGMGIGISACQSIIHAHGGFFEADNNPEGGAIFRFGLPMTEEDEET